MKEFTDILEHSVKQTDTDLHPCLNEWIYSEKVQSFVSITAKMRILARMERKAHSNDSSLSKRPRPKFY